MHIFHKWKYESGEAIYPGFYINWICTKCGDFKINRVTCKTFMNIEYGEGMKEVYKKIKENK